MAEDLKKKEKKLAKQIWITWIFGIVITVIFAMLYLKFGNSAFAFLSVFTFFIFSVVAAILEFKRMMIDAKLMWYNYRNNQSLSSGVLFIVTVIVVPAIYLAVILRYVPEEWKSAVQSILSCLVAAFPAFLSLLGIHYSNTIQQMSKNKETKDLNKPYPYITNGSIVHVKEDNTLELNIVWKVSNLANNILIPLCVIYDKKKYDFNYSPINGSTEGFVEAIGINLGCKKENSKYSFCFLYKDRLENKYKSEFELDLNAHDRRVICLSEPVQVFDE